MKEVTRIYFQCDHCKFEFLNESSCRIHETEDCLKNPELKCCRNCGDFRLELVENYDGSEDEEKPFCDHHQKFLVNESDFKGCSMWNFKF